jgi:hypothetical protein
MSWSAALVLCFATTAIADAPVRTETPEPAVCAQGSLQSSLRELEQQNAQPGEPASVPATSDAQASSPKQEPAWCEARLCMSDMDCPCRGYCDENSVCQYF